jgi:hypothetical protein
MATKKKRQPSRNRKDDAVRRWSTLTSSERQEMAGEFLADYPLTDGERQIFIQSPNRVNKILAIEKYRNARIVARIVHSEACIAGHGVGDTITFDSMGRLLTAAGDGPVCIRLLNRIWYRLIMILDRMADDTGNAVGGGNFKGEVIDVRMNCYGAPFPYGDCGQVLLEFSVEGLG